MMSGRNIFRAICIISVLISGISVSYAQIRETYDSIYYKSVSDSVERYIRKHPNRFKPDQNKLKVTPMAAINYTQEDGIGFFIGISGQYRNGFDTLAPLSNVTAIGYASTKGSLKVAVAGANYTSGGGSRLEYRASSFIDDRYFWGIGYENGTNSTNRSFFTETGVGIGAAYRFIISRNLNLAPLIGFDYYKASSFTYEHLVKDYPLGYTGFHIGADIVLDTKDSQISPTKGVYLKLKQKIHPRLFFQTSPFYQTAITADFFFKGWKGAVFAVDIFSESNYGDSPWFMWTPIGGDTRMRGYYYGRYRDRNTLIAQIELRQKIYKYHGAVLWGGAGNIFPSYREMDLKQTLPNYGIGYRFELGPLLFKLDAGFGRKGEWSILAGFNHAF